MSHTTKSNATSYIPRWPPIVVVEVDKKRFIPPSTWYCTAMSSGCTVTIRPFMVISVICTKIMVVLNT